MRFISEMLAGFYVSVVRLNRVMSKLVVDNENIQKNFDKGKDVIIAEPLYIILAGLGHDNAHEYVRKLTLESQKSGKPLIELAKKDESLEPFLKKLNKRQLEMLNNPEKYTGIAAEKTQKICSFWKKELRI
tara:strand:- start:79 stop:471 length:393 start_codon:yes stop_codon:yes gene_type:complete